MVRGLGVGSKFATVLTRAVRTGLIDVAMVSGRYTLLEQPAAEELLPACLEHGVQAVAVSVFNSGILARPEVGEDARYEYAQAPAELLDTARDLARLADRKSTRLNSSH